MSADDEPIDASERETERREKAERQLFELEQRRAHSGTIAAELELRALAVQHRAAYQEFVDRLQSAAQHARATGDPVVFRHYLMVQAKADLHLLGRMKPLTAWYIRQRLSSPVFVNRLLIPGRLGEQARARLLEYIEQHVYGPATEALWKQLGGEEQTPRLA